LVLKKWYGVAWFGFLCFMMGTGGGRL
jgi:hypothetical protein